VTTIEKQQMKITIAAMIAVLIFIIGLTAQFATWKATQESCHSELDDRITHLSTKFMDMREDINNLQEKASERDVELAKISTKLASIETLLVEIKTDLHEMK
jgi:peptidoglycan hydrolase CwlO-like protein